MHLQPESLRDLPGPKCHENEEAQYCNTLKMAQGDRALTSLTMKTKPPWPFNVVCVAVCVCACEALFSLGAQRKQRLVAASCQMIRGLHVIWISHSEKLLCFSYKLQAVINLTGPPQPETATRCSTQLSIKPSEPQPAGLKSAQSSFTVF